MFRRKKPKQAELDSELRFHLDELTEEKVAAGVDPAEARRQAAVEFGGGEQTREECLDVYRIALWDHTVANLKGAFRFIRKSPVFSLAIILTMALGIGANSAVFSAINAIILRSLPFPDANQLMTLRQQNTLAKNGETPVAPIRLEEWNRLSQSFQAIAGYYTQDDSETSGVLPEKLTEGIVTPRFLRVWGISPVVGRDFAPQEERFGGPAAALISHRLWRSRFHADPMAIGQHLHFGKTAYTIVGVLPETFIYPDAKVDFWTPGPPDAPYAQSRENTWYFAFGRLKPGVTLARARANMDAVQTSLGRQYPKTDKNLHVDVNAFRDSVTTASSRHSLWLLFGSVSLLLLIACTNIAALLLARVSERTREIAVRYSLGATRTSIVTQLLTESLILALIGSAIGFAVAALASSFLRSFAKALPRASEISLDGRIVLYTLVCALLSTFLFGLFPALQATRRSIAASLSGSSRSQVSGGLSLQWLLVGVQVALAATLLIGASLLLRSFQALGRVSPGFDPSHILTARVSGSWGETNDMKASNARVDRELNALRGTPGVSFTATSASLPGLTSQYPLDLELMEGTLNGEKIATDSKTVSSGYFETMRIPMLSGHGCRPNLTINGTVVVNRSFADTYLPGRTAVGRHLRFPNQVYMSAPAEILGVASDARENGISHAPMPTVYWCLSAPGPSPYILIRTVGEPAAMASAIRRKIHEVEPTRSVFDVAPLQDLLFQSNGENRFRTVLLSLFALTAISLAAIGLYGTLSYVVTLRHREVGLRMALGALPGQILRRFFLQGFTVALLGCLAGIALAAGLSRSLASMLFGVTSTDTLSYALVSLMVLLVAAIASVLPAARAAHFDPMKTLREQ